MKRIKNILNWLVVGTLIVAFSAGAVTVNSKVEAHAKKTDFHHKHQKYESSPESQPAPPTPKDCELEKDCKPHATPPANESQEQVKPHAQTPPEAAQTVTPHQAVPVAPQADIAPNPPSVPFATSTS